MKTVRQAKWLYILCSGLLSLFGIILLIWPTLSAKAVCSVMGTLFLLLGASKIVGYYSKDRYRLAFQFDLALGILVIIVGIILILRPWDILSVMAVMIGLYVLIDGVFKLQTALDAKRFGMKKWWLLLSGALVCVGFGAAMLFNLIDREKLLVSVAGVSILIDGIQNLFAAFYTVNGKKTDPYD